MKHYSLISKTWHIFSINSLLIKSYLVVQVLANIIAIILFFSIYYIVNKFSQKTSFDIKNKEIIRLFFMSGKRATFYLSEYL